LRKEVAVSFIDFENTRKKNFIDFLFELFIYSLEFRLELFSKCISSCDSNSIKMFDGLVNKIYDHVQDKLKISANVFKKLKSLSYFDAEMFCSDAFDLLANLIKGSSNSSGQSQFPIEDFIVTCLRLKNFRGVKDTIVEAKCSL